MRRRARTVATFGGRQLGWVAGVAAIVLALLALGVAGFWPLTPIDRLVDRLVGSLRGGSLYDLMLVVTALGDGLFLTLVAVVTIASFLFTGARWRAMCYTLCFGSMPVVVHTIKLWIARPRPSDIPYTGVDQFSFPSSRPFGADLWRRCGADFRHLPRLDAVEPDRLFPAAGRDDRRVAHLSRGALVQ